MRDWNQLEKIISGMGFYSCPFLFAQRSGGKPGRLKDAGMESEGMINKSNKKENMSYGNST